MPTKTIPEPGNTTALIGIGIIGVGLFLYQFNMKLQQIRSPQPPFSRGAKIDNKAHLHIEMVLVAANIKVGLRKLTTCDV